MRKKDSSYIRLPGRRGLGIYALYMGPDHLLTVTRKLAVEEYKRFYYNDIQAVVTSTNDHFKTVNIALAAVSALMFVFAVISGNPVATAFFNTMGVFFLLGFLGYYLLWGADCTCYLQTAVQIEKLPSLGRFKKVDKTMAMLIPIIEGVQGKLLPETIENEKRKPPQPTSPAVGALNRPEVSAGITVTKHETVAWHYALFCLLIITGGYLVFVINYRHVMVVTVESLLSLLLGILAIASAVRQHKSDMTYNIRITTWATLGYVGLDFLVGMILYMVITVKNLSDPSFVSNQFVLIKQLAGLSPADYPALMGWYIFAICTTLGLGLYGLISLRTYQSRSSVTAS